MARSSLGFFLQNLASETVIAKADPTAKAATG